MSVTAFVEPLTIADLLEELGDISPQRIRLSPAPGMATEKDVVRIESQENRLYELIDGVLVEKAMGARESLIAGVLIHLIWDFLKGKQGWDKFARKGFAPTT